MQKAWKKIEGGLKRYSLSIGVLGIALIIVSTHLATAQQGGNGNNGNSANSLGNHHSEFTLTADPGELVYIPVPKTNFPVNIQVVQSGNGPGIGQVTAFTVSSLPNGVITTVPVNMSDPAGGTSTLREWGYCSDEASLSLARVFQLSGSGVNIECSKPVSEGGIQDIFVVGVTERDPNFPDRIVLGVLKPSNQLVDTFYIQMWY